MNMNDVNVNAEKGSNSNDNDDNLSNELSNINIHIHTSSRHCLYCLKQVEGSMKCSKCRTALYCGRGCQEKHWPVHKNMCQDSNNTEDDDEKLRTKATNHFQQGNRMHTFIP